MDRVIVNEDLIHGSFQKVDYDYNPSIHDWISRQNTKIDGKQTTIIRFKKKRFNSQGYKKIRIGSKQPACCHNLTTKEGITYWVEFKREWCSMDTPGAVPATTSDPTGQWWQWVDKRIFDSDWYDFEYELGVNNLIKDKALINKIKTEYRDDIDAMCDGWEDSDCE